MDTRNTVRSSTLQGHRSHPGPTVTDVSTWPSSVYRDPELGAVLVLATYPSIADRMDRWLSIAEHSFDPDVLTEGWSSTERALISLALAVWGSAHQDGVAESMPHAVTSLFATMGASQFLRVVLAFEVRRGELTLKEALRALGEPVPA